MAASVNTPLSSSARSSSTASSSTSSDSTASGSKPSSSKPGVAKRSSSIGIVIERADVELGPAPIPADWVIDGNPVATNWRHSTSADESSAAFVWQCTPGRFNWFYGVDEWLYILEGEVTLTEPDGLVRRMGAGDFVFFPGGTWATWEIHSTVRKVAIMRECLTRPLRATKKLVLFGKKLMGKKPPITGM